MSKRVKHARRLVGKPKGLGRKVASLTEGTSASSSSMSSVEGDAEGSRKRAKTSGKELAFVKTASLPAPGSEAKALLHAPSAPLPALHPAFLVPLAPAPAWGSSRPCPPATPLVQTAPLLSASHCLTYVPTLLDEVSGWFLRLGS